MKRLTLLTSALLLITAASFAQSKTEPKFTLPKTVTVTLTQQQFLRLDSAVTNTANSLDSKSYSKWFALSFSPIYEAINKQLVPVDTSKVKK